MDFQLDRRHSGFLKGGSEDLRVELGELALKGFAPLALLTGVSLVSGAILAANCYADPRLWLAALAAALITAARIPIIVKIANRPQILAERFGLLWISAYGMITTLLCVCMATLTVYSFSMHREALQILCVMGSFTICSGISSRCRISTKTAMLWRLSTPRTSFTDLPIFLSSIHPLSPLHFLLLIPD